MFLCCYSFSSTFCVSMSVSLAGSKYVIVIRHSFYVLPFSHSFAFLFT